ncbi:hypothetical protein F4809DRAFT_599612 [Biscogniauxia mediterranea]|nr:hypothetical protein F4809DRAFT_599612 [Biscogniauxia mediterranea]
MHKAAVCNTRPAFYLSIYLFLSSSVQPSQAIQACCQLRTSMNTYMGGWFKRQDPGVNRNLLALPFPESAYIASSSTTQPDTTCPP